MSKIISDNFQYFGQVTDDNLLANGIGKIIGTWGMYEGQIENGMANGYGRLILTNERSLYLGMFKNNKYHGAG